MEPSTHTRKTSLPGVGTRYDLETGAGPHLSVVVRQDGRRILAFHDPEDDDSCKDAATLTPHEATALANLLTDDPVAHLHQQVEIDLVTEHIEVTKRSPYAGRTLGSTQARTRTGASIVAVLRRTAAVPSPTPDFRFAIGDTLVVVGTREGVDAVAELIIGG
ncbi:TrkA C-terminal domain-containing protein [Streptomyces diacarni]|uniref:Potassium transporter TrkA n=1 Tax=Streptomyces diacarni TaxID=2800381 RepID=A0A367F4A4_9ACTN|nr:TrkA C-terminal domain-containing protein [Streptomyces diacarni]RCG24692.1 potassium transporter TrkA [Streptomyces diacarni]